jgi:hypothetical protein
MKRVEYWKWMTWNNQRTKKTQTRYVMTEEEALRRHPEAVRVEGTCEVRELPETEDELRAGMTSPKLPTRARQHLG